MIIRLELRELRDTKLAPKCPLQHRRLQRIQGRGGISLVALECVGLRMVVAFGRKVHRRRRPGSDEAVRHLPEG
jgi:hypothetical protein